MFKKKTKQQIGITFIYFNFPNNSLTLVFPNKFLKDYRPTFQMIVKVYSSLSYTHLLQYSYI